jgi:hypothetical protein
MKTPYEMGVVAYAREISQWMYDVEYLASLEGMSSGQVVGAHKEWNRGYVDAHLEATVFGEWNWGDAAKKVEKIGLPIPPEE